MASGLNSIWASKSAMKSISRLMLLSSKKSSPMMDGLRTIVKSRKSCGSPKKSVSLLKECKFYMKFLRGEGINTSFMGFNYYRNQHGFKPPRDLLNTGGIFSYRVQAWSSGVGAGRRTSGLLGLGGSSSVHLRELWEGDSAESSVMALPIVTLPSNSHPTNYK